jgi:hypothetical protein
MGEAVYAVEVGVGLVGVAAIAVERQAAVLRLGL